MLKFFHTWFGYGASVNDEQKTGRVLEVEPKERHKGDITQPYKDLEWKDKPDGELKEKRMKETIWGTSRTLDLLWSKTDVSEPNDVKVLPGTFSFLIESSKYRVPSYYSTRCLDLFLIWYYN